jgi:beta-fructofuranosidase
MEHIIFIINVSQHLPIPSIRTYYHQTDNPTDVVAGNQHWGHATTKDLYTWTNQPIAIFPDNPGDGIFSGSAVIDVNNTSGFFSNQTDGVVAIYTLNTAAEQTQEIAFSVDGGYTFTKYANNPVISINSTQFRDPKVIWHASTSKWVMSIAHAQDYVISFYTSIDLKSWHLASNFSHHGLLGQQYECPNMVAIPSTSEEQDIYVLLISINPGAPLGGSATQYFPGTFNGTHFVPVDAATRIADFGKDFYAAQFFYGTPAGSPPIGIGWASNWQYSQSVPTGQLEGWRSTMTLPKEYSFVNSTRRGWDLVAKPYPLTSLYTEKLASNSSLGNGTTIVDFSTLPSGSIYFAMNITNIPTVNTTGTANFTLTSSTTGESLRGGYFLGGDVPFFINRGHVNGFGDSNPFFTDKFSTNSIVNNGTWQFEGVFDRSILEVFLDGGVQSATSTIYPEGPLDQVSISTSGLNTGIGVSVEIWGLRSTWGVGKNATTGMRIRDLWPL